MPRSCLLLGLITIGVVAQVVCADETNQRNLSSGWIARAARPSMLPKFSTRPLRQGDSSSPLEAEGLVIEAGDSIGQHGWAEKEFAVVGDHYYRFHTKRKTENIIQPRRSAVVRIRWLNDDGKMIPADIPKGHENDPGYDPLAEPEHPTDGEVDAENWVAISGVYRAPSKATRAVVELHLQWAPLGKVFWSEPTFVETDAPAPRLVRLAAVHYTPSGKSPRENCEEFAPLVAEAGRQKADLVVLGETIPYVRVGKTPFETAESVPGPTTDYFGALAKEHRLHIVFSLFEVERDVVYNTAVLLAPDGTLVGKFRKVCLPHSEIEAGVTPGNDYPVFETKLGKVGMMVCYDGFFPEVARELTNRGAEIIAWPVWGCNPLLARARACENHVFLISSTYSPKDDWMTTAVFDRGGKSLVEAKHFGEVVVTTVDLSQPHFWKNNLGDFRSMIPRHRP